MFSLHMTSEIPKKPNHNFDEKCMRRRSPKESGQIFNTGKCHRLELMGGGAQMERQKICIVISSLYIRKVGGTNYRVKKLFVWVIKLKHTAEFNI